MITVFTPTFNRAYRLDKLYESLRNQSTMDFEWIVINDGSTDNTDDLFNEWQKENNGFSIIHYSGYKPWEAGSFHFDIEKIWWDYAKKTTYYEKVLDAFVTDVLNDAIVSDYIRMLEKEFLEGIMTDSRAEDYAISLNDGIRELNAALEKSILF